MEAPLGDADAFQQLADLRTRVETLESKPRALVDRDGAERRGTAGGRARARDAVRRSDGRFMGYAELQSLVDERSARAVAGGLARVRKAARDGLGRFEPSNAAGRADVSFLVK